MSYECPHCGKEYKMKSYFDAHVAEHEEGVSLEELLMEEAHTLFDKVPRSGLKKAAVKELADKIREL